MREFDAKACVHAHVDWNRQSTPVYVTNCCELEFFFALLMKPFGRGHPFFGGYKWDIFRFTALADSLGTVFHSKICTLVKLLTFQMMKNHIVFLIANYSHIRFRVVYICLSWFGATQKINEEKNS